MLQLLSSMYWQLPTLNFFALSTSFAILRDCWVAHQPFKHISRFLRYIYTLPAQQEIMLS